MGPHFNYIGVCLYCLLYVIADLVALVWFCYWLLLRECSCTL